MWRFVPPTSTLEGFAPALFLMFSAGRVNCAVLNILNIPPLLFGPRQVNTQDIMRTALISVTAFALFLLMLEMCFRLVVYLEKGSHEDRYLVLPDAALGWSLNTRMRPKRFRNKCGEAVNLAPAPHRLILKSPGNTDKKKILFLGDSYTHAHEVSTGKAYYDVFEQLEMENYAVYVVAVGGYGNLQEYLALEAVFSLIQPDIAVWQLTENDVGNNVYELDEDSLRRNQRPRPYLEPQSGKISIRNPGIWLFDWSEGFAYLFIKLLILDSKHNLGIIAWLNSFFAMDADSRNNFEKQGLAVLNQVVSRAVNSYSETTFVGFSVDPRYDRQYQAIFNNNGALYLASFFKELETGGKTDCRPLDTHWNHVGNQVAGVALSKRIREALIDD